MPGQMGISTVVMRQRGRFIDVLTEDGTFLQGYRVNQIRQADDDVAKSGWAVRNRGDFYPAPLYANGQPSTK